MKYIDVFIGSTSTQIFGEISSFIWEPFGITLVACIKQYYNTYTLIKQQNNLIHKILKKKSHENKLIESLLSRVVTHT